jgi:hypothetical protein
MATRKPTVADAMGKIDTLAESVGKLAEIVVARADGGERTEAKSSEPQARTVKLPDLTKHTEARRAMGVDGTYKENVAIFKLREDGTPVCKKDGTVRKPTRVRVEDVRYLLAHQEDVESLCDFIESQD